LGLSAKNWQISWYDLTRRNVDPYDPACVICVLANCGICPPAPTFSALSLALLIMLVWGNSTCVEMWKETHSINWRYKPCCSILIYRSKCIVWWDESERSAWRYTSRCVICRYKLSFVVSRPIISLQSVVTGIKINLSVCSHSQAKQTYHGLSGYTFVLKRTEWTSETALRVINWTCSKSDGLRILFATCDATLFTCITPQLISVFLAKVSWWSLVYTLTSLMFVQSRGCTFFSASQ